MQLQQIYGFCSFISYMPEIQAFSRLLFYIDVRYVSYFHITIEFWLFCVVPCGLKGSKNGRKIIVYIRFPNYNKQNYPLSKLRLLVKKFGQ